MHACLQHVLPFEGLLAVLNSVVDLPLQHCIGLFVTLCDKLDFAQTLCAMTLHAYAYSLAGAR